MNIVIFDTETTSLQKPFCYNVGYVIFNTENKTVLKKADYVVEQIWHNNELFSTAYYAEKRPLYITAMRKRQAILDKFGYICRKMYNDFKAFDVQFAYAYNSSFDENVFQYNCDWFKTINPFDSIQIFDIRGYVHNYIAFLKDYQKFCDDNELYTDTGNYSTTAENVYRYISNDLDFSEQHTALSDSEIELQILLYCLEKGAVLNNEYKVYNSIPRKVKHKLKIHLENGEIHSYEYYKKTARNKGDNIYLK